VILSMVLTRFKKWIAMPNFKPHDLKFLVDELFGSPSGSGYVMDFSNKTFDEFFDGELQLNIYDPRYSEGHSGSKANCLRAFLMKSDGPTVAKALRALWEYRDAVYGPYDEDEQKVNAFKKRFFDLVMAVETSGDAINTDIIDRFSDNESLDELVKAIQRDIQAGKPQAALDRLHTYCMKLFGHLIEQLGGRVTTEDTLNGRAAMYIKALEARGGVQGTTIQLMRTFIGVFDKFNHTRNQASFAHDNELAEKNEARLIFEGITAILRYLKNTEASRFIH
jgi:hypothetical protein